MASHTGFSVTRLARMRDTLLTAEQKARSPFFGNFWGARGWGLGLSVVTRRNGTASYPDALAGTARSARPCTSTHARTWWVCSCRRSGRAR